MKKVVKYLAIAVVAAIFAGTFFYLWKSSRPEEIVYGEVVPEYRDICKSTLVTGKIEPRDEVNIKPQISGIISELCKEAGQTVKAGEVIAKVKVIPEMSSLSSAQSRVRLSQINLNQAKTNFERMKALYEKDLVSADEYEKVRQSYEQAKEEAAAAEDALEVVRDGVSSSNASSSSTLIRSTISGLILNIPVKVGNSVINSNTFNDGTTIATVADMDDLIFDGNIDETEVGMINVGMPVKISIGALRNLSFDAHLEYISPKATENNGTSQFELKAAVNVPDSVTVRSGYSANAEIILQRAEHVLSIPESVISFENDSAFVYVKVGEQEYSRRFVSMGISDGINVQALSGISENDVLRGAVLKSDK